MANIYKIGTTPRGNRIWLDGSKLVAAGFKGGTTYQLEVGDKLTLTIAKEGRKVTGRPDGKPIIDMIGGWVTTWAKGATHVSVTFDAGRITIEKA